MFAALRARGREVEYIVFRAEGHEFTRTQGLLRAREASNRSLVDYLVGGPRSR